MKEVNSDSDNSFQQNLEIPQQIGEPILHPCSVLEQKQLNQEDDELSKLLLPNVNELPTTPPTAVETNFTTYYAPGTKLEHKRNVNDEKFEALCDF